MPWLPMRKRRPPAPVFDEEADARDQAASGWRAGDDGLGVPDPAPANARALSRDQAEQELQPYKEALRARLEQELEALDGAGGWPIPPALRAWASQLALLAVGVLGLLIVSQATSTLGNLAALPPVGQWMAGGALALAAGVCVYVGARLFWLYGSLRRARQVNLRALRLVEERRKLQRLAAEVAHEARAALENYLRTYALDGRAGEALKAAGLSAAALETLRAQRARLLNRNLGIDNAVWVEEFRRRFQAPLDQAARERVYAHSRKVFAATAVSPNPLLDQLLVGYCCTAMVGDLLRLYGVRPAWGLSAVLLAKAVGMAYLAGALDDVADTAADSLSDYLADAGVQALSSKLVGALAGKAAEGALNGYLLYRLGKQVIRQLQPTRES